MFCEVTIVYLSSLAARVEGMVHGVRICERWMAWLCVDGHMVNSMAGSVVECGETAYFLCHVLQRQHCS